MLRYALALLATPLAAEQPDRISFLLGSDHIGLDHLELNEFHPSVFLTWETEVLDYTAGVFYNSFEGVSVSATAHYPLVEWDSGQLDVFAGAAYYDNSRYGLVPLAGVQVRQGSMFAQAIPMSIESSQVLVTLGVTYELDSF